MSNLEYRGSVVFANSEIYTVIFKRNHNIKTTGNVRTAVWVHVRQKFSTIEVRNRFGFLYVWLFKIY